MTRRAPKARPLTGPQTTEQNELIRFRERRRILDALRARTVLMTRADGQEVAAVQWSHLLEALEMKP